MSGSVDRLLEAIRQRALVRSGRLYGQVECAGGYGHAADVLFDGACYICGAAV